MDSAGSLVLPGALGAPGLRLGESCDRLSPTLGMGVEVSASSARLSALAEAPVSNDGCRGRKTRKGGDIRGADLPSGIMMVPDELRAVNAEGGCTVPGNAVAYALVNRNVEYGDTPVPATQMLLHREPNARGEQPTVDVEEAGLLPQSERLQLIGSGDYGEQSNLMVPGIGGQPGLLEGECSVATDNIHARTENAGSDSGQSSSAAAGVLNPSSDDFRRKAHDIITSVCIALQRCGTGTRDSYVTDGYRGRHLGGDASRAPACSTTAPVDPAIRILRSLCTERTFANGLLTTENSRAMCFVPEGVRVPHPNCCTLEEPSAPTCVALGNQATDSPNSSPLHNATLHSVCLPRGERDGLPPSNRGDTQMRNAVATSRGKASILLLLEQINGKAPAAPRVSMLTNSLGGTVSRINGVHSSAICERALLHPPQGNTERDLAHEWSTLRGNVNNPLDAAEIQALGRGRGTMAARIQTLPAGKHLGDYYLIGPILDVCMQPQQLHKPDTGRRPPNKRVHSRQTKPLEANHGILSRKVCRRESLQRNPREVTAITCSNANRMRGADRTLLQELTQIRDKELARMLERRLNGAGAETLMSRGTGAESENNVATQIENVAGRGRANRLLHPCDTHVNANNEVGEETPPVERRLSNMQNQLPNTGYNSGRPVLRFAVARNLPVGNTERSPVKIIKSIEKRRIPASAGGDRLWRRLCERLLNLPPHPNVLSVEAILEDPAFYHFVFERLEGGELFAFLLREKVIDEPVCQYIIYQILLALHHLHSHNLLHRDIKPENLVFRRRRQKTAEPLLPESSARGCWRSSLASSSSSTVVPSSTSKQSSNSSPTHVYSEMAGDHSPTNTGSFPSTSSSSSSSCTVGPCDVNSILCSRGRSASPNAAQTGFPHLSVSTAPARTPGLSLSPSNSSTGSRRRRNATDNNEVADFLLPHRVGAGEETAEDQYRQTGGERRPRKTMLETIKDYELVLIDFDTCKMMEVPCEEYGEVVGGRRRLVGTYGYLAPEVLCGHAYSTQSDLWSVGIILYVLMTGTPPLPMEDMVSACSSLNVFLEMHEEHGGIPFGIPPLSESPLAQDLCQRLLRLSRKDRLSSAWSALSHPWFDNLKRGSPREDLRSTIPSHSDGISPAADQRAPCCDPRERTTFDGFYRCPVPQPPAASPLRIPPLSEPFISPPSCGPGHTPLAFPSSAISAESRAFAAADLSAHGCAPVFLSQSANPEQNDAQRSTAQRRRE